MKRIIFLTLLLSNSIFALESYIDRPEYQYFKPFLKEEQQKVFNDLMSNSQSAIDNINTKINVAKTVEEKKELEQKKSLIIRDKENLIKNLQCNILTYPERYTKAAINLKSDINKIINSYLEVR